MLGLGEAAVTAALNPQSTLGSAPSHKAAEAALGESIQPNLMLDFTTLLALLEGVGLTSDPSLAPLLPYLRSATTLDGGGHVLQAKWTATSWSSASATARAEPGAQPVGGGAGAGVALSALWKTSLPALTRSTA